MNSFLTANYSALQVANYLVGRSLAGELLTNMALQKILYFAEGRYLASQDRLLFDSRIEAWDYGPVVPDVYHEFKRYGSHPITERASTLDMSGGVQSWTFTIPDLPHDVTTRQDRAFLDQIWSDYGTRSAVALMRESHRPGGPWDQVYSRGHRHTEIPPETLRAYFAQQG